MPTPVPSKVLPADAAKVKAKEKVKEKEKGKEKAETNRTSNEGGMISPESLEAP